MRSSNRHKGQDQPGVVFHPCCASAQVAEGGGSEVQRQVGLKSRGEEEGRGRVSQYSAIFPGTDDPGVLWYFPLCFCVFTCSGLLSHCPSAASFSCFYHWTFLSSSLAKHTQRKWMFMWRKCMCTLRVHVICACCMYWHCTCHMYILKFLFIYLMYMSTL